MKRLQKKSAILLIIFFSMAGISFIHAVRIPFIRGSLNNSELFQKNYGDKPQTLILATIPEDQWKNVTLKKWNFSRTTFRYTQFDNVTFDNCTFDNITFLKLIVTNCRFINYRFEKCTVASGKWSKSTFAGGSINTMMFIPYEPSGNDYWYSWVTWEDLSFESMRIEKLWPHKRSGRWDRTKLTDVELVDCDFIYMDINDPVMRKCVLRGNHFYNIGDGGIHDLDIEDSSFDNNGPYVWLGGRFKNIKICEPEGISLSGKSENIEIRQTKDISVENVRNLTIQGPVDGYVLIDNGTDVKIGEVNGDFSLRGNCASVSVEKVRSREIELSGGTFRNCSFKDMECKDIDISEAVFTQSAFQDILIKEKIWIRKTPVFSDCSIVNFRRLPEVKVFEYSDKPPVTYLFPWESAPGVMK